MAWVEDEQNKSSGSIWTFSGEEIDPLHPDARQLHMEDIAHALSMLSRANGHFKSMHSVAQHCMECATEARARGYGPQIVLFCLLHDGAEAYLGDFVSPVKHRMQDYNNAEKTLLTMIYQTFAGAVPDEAQQAVVKEIDRTLLYYEFEVLMGRPVGPEPGRALVSSPDFAERNWREVEKDYLKMYEELKGLQP